MQQKAFADHAVLTFDVVGTCIDFEAGIASAVEQIAGPSSELDRATVLEAFGRAEDRQQHETPQLPFTQMLEPIYNRLAHDLGLPEGPAEAAALRASIPAWPAFPDSADALSRLATRFHLVALTNADRWALEQMSATLGSPFDDGVTAEDVGVNKPSPRVFDYCRGRLSAHGYRLTDIGHVAQSQYHDIAAAKNLGYQVCWVERRRHKPGWGATPEPSGTVVPDLHVGSLEELATAMGL